MYLFPVNTVSKLLVIKVFYPSTTQQRQRSRSLNMPLLILIQSQLLEINGYLRSPKIELREFDIVQTVHRNYSHQKTNKMHLYVCIHSKIFSHYMFRKYTTFIIRNFYMSLFRQLLYIANCDYLLGLIS